MGATEALLCSSTLLMGGALEGQCGAGADEDGQLVDALEGDAVEVEDILAAVEVGGRKAELQD